MSDSVSRRTFIGSTAAAVAGATAFRSTAQTDARAHIGFVGLGTRGQQLLTLFQSIENAKVVALCDDYRPHLDVAQQRALPGFTPYNNFNLMLTNEALDAIVIATPPNQQHAMCAAAIDRGLAVYCETPMGLTIDEGLDLADRVRKSNAIFQVGLQRRTNAVYEQAEAMIQTGMLGEITAVKCQWHVNSDERREVPVSQENPNYAKLDRKLNWRLYRDLSQGLMTEFGVHQLDVVNRMLGTAPRRVMAMGGNDFWHDGRDAYDNVFCTYEYEVGTSNGNSRVVRAAFSSVLTNAYEGMTELVMGTKGTFLLSPKLGLYYRELGDDSPWVQFDARSGATDVAAETPWAHRGKPVQIEAKGNDTRAALISFVESVASGSRKTACNTRTGLESMATALIANQAIESGTVVAFPADCRIA